MKKIIIINFVMLLFINCSNNTLCRYDILGDEWCIKYADDKEVVTRSQERINRRIEENKTPEERFKDKLKTIIGKSQKDIIIEFGVPTKTENIGGLEILSYIEDKGMKTIYSGGGSGFVLGNNIYSGSSGTYKSINNFKRIDLIFENDKLIKGTYTEN